MNIYTYKAAEYCEECIIPIKADPVVLAKLHAEFPDYDGDNEYSWDSGTYPKGPDNSNYHESDAPCHCDQCGLFLENRLTKEGEQYVIDIMWDRLVSDSTFSDYVAEYKIKVEFE